tara:strand:+ start:230 stop:361 length:132 start_codon:yes stop_codon:yes gene_type:complete
MIKRIALIMILSCMSISCGKKDDPKYIDPEKKTEIKRIIIKIA